MNSGELGGVSPGMCKAVEILHLPILAMVEEPQRIGRQCRNNLKILFIFQVKCKHEVLALPVLTACFCTLLVCSPDSRSRKTCDVCPILGSVCFSFCLACSFLTSSACNRAYYTNIPNVWKVSSVWVREGVFSYLCLIWAYRMVSFQCSFVFLRKVEIL